MRKILDIFSKKKEKSKKVKIEVDYRERNSLVPSLLMKGGFELEWKQLPVADYIVNGIAIERKTVSDLKGSIVNKRIISQLMELRQYKKCYLFIEGIIEENIYSSSGVHENAFRGFLLSVSEFNVPVIYTHDEKDTAMYLSVLARKKEKGEKGIRASKILFTKEERRQFILEGFPNVGGVKANKLIEKFGSLRKIFEASEEELEEVLGKRAREFSDLLD